MIRCLDPDWAEPSTYTDLGALLERCYELHGDSPELFLRRRGSLDGPPSAGDAWVDANDSVVAEVLDDGEV
jgi:hypothetical protein